MGRKSNFAERTPSGPGRKARKQKPPELPSVLLKEERKLGTTDFFFNLPIQLDI